MKPTYLDALREASTDNIRCLFVPAAWRDLRAGMVALTFILLRLVMLLTYPISTPLMAWVILENERAQHRAWRHADRDWMGE